MYSLQKLTELLFDVYDVPAVAFAYDGVCTHYGIQQEGQAVAKIATLVCAKTAPTDKDCVDCCRHSAGHVPAHQFRSCLHPHLP